MPAGYKQTEVGVIPEDWDIKPLGNVVDFLDGKRRPVKDSDRAKMRGDIPYYGASGIVDYVNDFLFDEDLILLGEDGENILSRNCRLAFKISGKTWVNNHAHVLRPKQGMLLDYLNEFLESRDYAQYNTGTAQPKLNKLVCSGIPVLCPPLPQQRAIAGALNDMDELIDGLDQLIAKKRDLKQATMQQLLTGQTRLPGFETKRGYKQTEMGVIPQDWETATLSALSSMKSGEGITSTNIDQFSKYPCYGGNGLRGFTTRFTHDGRYALVGRQGALCGNVVGVEGKFFASEHAIVVTASPRTDIRWLTLVLGEMHLNQYSESSAQPGLSVSKILSLIIACPLSKAEQTAIAEVLSDMDAELAALEQRRDKTNALKQGMMQELLTGRTRLV